MAEQDRADAPDRFAQGSGRTEKHEAERDGFRPGETGGGQSVLPNTSGEARAEGAEGARLVDPRAQAIESTTAALGDMEPSAGSGGASRAETDNDDDAP